MRPSIPTSVLLDAAAGLVAERGFEGVRMDAIAARAGVAKGVPYGRFASKDELLRAMIDRELVLAMGRSIELVRADPEGGRLSRMWVQAIAALHERPALLRLYSGTGSPLARVAAERSDRVRIRSLIGSGFVRELQEADLVDPSLDAEALAATLALWNHALATTAPRPDLAALLAGMGELLARAADTGRGDPAVGVEAFARLVGALISERTT